MDILVPVDQTNASRVAAREALSKAESLDATVVFTHCIADTPNVEDDIISYDLGEAEENGEAIINDMRELSTEYDVRGAIFDIVREDDVVQGILSEIDARSPDFVFIGHRNIAGWDQPVASTAKRLIKESPVPVTVVTPENGG